MASWPFTGGGPRDRYTDSPNSALQARGYGNSVRDAVMGAGGAATGGFSWRDIIGAIRGNAELGVGTPATMGPGSVMAYGAGRYPATLTGGNLLGPRRTGPRTDAPTSTTQSWLDRLPNTAEEWAGMAMDQREKRGVPPVFRGKEEAGDIVQDYWQEQYDRYLAGIAADEKAIKAGYSPVLEGLEDQVGDLRAAAASLGIPFDEYLARRNEIGAGVGDAEGLGPSIQPVVSKVYDDADAEMKKVYQQIDMNFGREVTTQLNGRVRELEGVMEDVIRTDESAVDLLHKKSSEYAKAMAQAAYSNDVYAAIEAETKINAELDYKIEQTEEEIARQKRAMQAAIDAATDKAAAMFEYGEPEFGKVVDEAWNEYFSNNNVPEHERAQAKAIFEQLIADPANGLNESTWRRGINQYLNQAILNTIGISNEDIEDRMTQTGDTSIMSILATQDLANLFKKGQTGALQSALEKLGYSPSQARGIVAKGSGNADRFMGLNSPEALHLRNMYTTRNDISKNWDSIVAKFGPTVDESQVARAPNGFTFPIVGGGSYSNSFGYKRSAAAVRSGKMPVHQGIDIMASKGSHMVSPVDGTVMAMDYGNTGGNYIKIRDNQGYVHYMAHMNSLSNNLQPGSKVKAGTFVGTVGNTGNARNTSPHVHYEIKAKNGNRVNPYSWLQSTGR